MGRENTLRNYTRITEMFYIDYVKKFNLFILSNKGEDMTQW